MIELTIGALLLGLSFAIAYTRLQRRERLTAERRLKALNEHLNTMREEARRLRRTIVSLELSVNVQKGVIKAYKDARTAERLRRRYAKVGGTLAALADWQRKERIRQDLRNLVRKPPVLISSHRAGALAPVIYPGKPEEWRE